VLEKKGICASKSTDVALPLGEVLIAVDVLVKGRFLVKWTDVREGVRARQEKIMLYLE